jgi:putative protein kinase ArgK-like GTPase of G3E family
MQVLLFMLDVNGYPRADGTTASAFGDLMALVTELRKYSPDWLHSRHCLVCVNKMDSPEAELRFAEFQQLFATAVNTSQIPAETAVVAVSAQVGTGLPVLARVLRNTVEAALATAVDDSVIEPAPQSSGPFVPAAVLEAWQGTSSSRSRLKPKSKRRSFEEYLYGQDAEIVEQYRQQAKATYDNTY